LKRSMLGPGRGQLGHHLFHGFGVHRLRGGLGGSLRAGRGLRLGLREPGPMRVRNSHEQRLRTGSNATSWDLPPPKMWGIEMAGTRDARKRERRRKNLLRRGAPDKHRGGGNDAPPPRVTRGPRVHLAIAPP
jgi:hypothetical protein